MLLSLLFGFNDHGVCKPIADSLTTRRQHHADRRGKRGNEHSEIDEIQNATNDCSRESAWKFSHSDRTNAHQPFPQRLAGLTLVICPVETQWNKRIDDTQPE